MESVTLLTGAGFSLVHGAIRIHSFPWAVTKAAREPQPPTDWSEKEREMSESVYKVIEMVGTSTDSWEKAAAAAVEIASQSLRNLRVAEVSELDMVIEDGKVRAYRAKVKVSFKYGGE